VRTHDIPFNDIVAHIHMKDKVLSLTPLNFGMAGGDITSNITLDGRQKTIAAQAKVAARHLKIRELFPKLQSMQASFGEVYGDAALTGHGNLSPPCWPARMANWPPPSAKVPSASSCWNWRA
jgi:uncharacterized protein involved in outer membrane biogenesis